jgi:hypothetical protein
MKMLKKGEIIEVYADNRLSRRYQVLLDFDMQKAEEEAQEKHPELVRYYGIEREDGTYAPKGEYYGIEELLTDLIAEGKIKKVQAAKIIDLDRTSCEGYWRWRFEKTVASTFQKELHKEVDAVADVEEEMQDVFKEELPWMYNDDLTLEENLKIAAEEHQKIEDAFEENENA